MKSFDLAPSAEVTISEDARTKIEEWGIDAASVQGLTEILAKFGYGDPRQTIESVIQLGVIYDRDQGVIQLPYFYSFDPDIYSPDCRDQAWQYIIKLKENNLEGGLRRSDGDLHVVALQGNDNQHFRQPGTNHHFVGIAKDKDQDGTIAHDDTKEMIIVDPTRRSIGVYPGNGYSFAPERCMDVTNISNPVIHDATCTLKVGQLHIDPNPEKTVLETYHTIIGASQDGSRIYALGFLEYNGTLRPVIETLLPSGTSKIISLNIPEGYWELTIGEGDPSALGDPLVSSMLSRLSTIQVQNKINHEV